MGVSCHITLPDRVRVQDVAEVMGLLAGMKAEERPFTSSDGTYLQVPGVRVRSTGQAELCHITFEHEDEWYSATYFFEWEAGGRGIIVGSYPFWIALARRLVDFFGGSVDYSDCDDVDCDYSAPEQPGIAARTDEDWHLMKRRKRELRPLTPEEIEAVGRAAAYA